MLVKMRPEVLFVVLLYAVNYLQPVVSISGEESNSFDVESNPFGGVETNPQQLSFFSMQPQIFGPADYQGQFAQSGEYSQPNNQGGKSNPNAFKSKDAPNRLMLDTEIDFSSIPRPERQIVSNSNGRLITVTPSSVTYNNYAPSYQQSVGFEMSRSTNVNSPKHFYHPSSTIKYSKQVTVVTHKSVTHINPIQEHTSKLQTVNRHDGPYKTAQNITQYVTERGSVPMQHYNHRYNAVHNSDKHLNNILTIHSTAGNSTSNRYKILANVTKSNSLTLRNHTEHFSNITGYSTLHPNITKKISQVINQRKLEDRYDDMKKQNRSLVLHDFVSDISQKINSAHLKDIKLQRHFTTNYSVKGIPHSQLEKKKLRNTNETIISHKNTSVANNIQNVRPLETGMKNVKNESKHSNNNNSINMQNVFYKNVPLNDHNNTTLNNNSHYENHSVIPIVSSHENSVQGAYKRQSRTGKIQIEIQNNSNPLQDNVRYNNESEIKELVEFVLKSNKTIERTERDNTPVELIRSQINYTDIYSYDHKNFTDMSKISIYENKERNESFPKELADDRPRITNVTLVTTGGKTSGSTFDSETRQSKMAEMKLKTSIEEDRRQRYTSNNILSVSDNGIILSSNTILIAALAATYLV